MQAFNRHEGVVALLSDTDINTDSIIRIERLMLVPRRDLGIWAFEMLRFDPQGRVRPECVLNHAPFDQASILVCGRNFGCGSSRETAVWAIVGRGIRCVIAPSFGDIFRENCIRNGVLPIVLDAAVWDTLAADCAGVEPVSSRMEIDLAAQRLRSPTGREIAFEIPPFDREVLLSGEDEVATTLRSIDVLQARHRDWQARNAWATPDTPAPALAPLISS